MDGKSLEFKVGLTIFLAAVILVFGIMWFQGFEMNRKTFVLYAVFPMVGGIDKRRLAAGRTAIDEELESKVPGVLASGGYIPCIDHGVPPDVSWENFQYYRKRLTGLVDGTGTLI